MDEHKANEAALYHAICLLRRRAWIIRLQRIVIALLCAALIASCAVTGYLVYRAASDERKCTIQAAVTCRTEMPRTERGYCVIKRKRDPRSAYPVPKTVGGCI